MLRGLTRAGLGDMGSDKEFIKQAAAYGFDTVDADAAALIEQNGETEAKALLKTHNITIGSIGLPVEWRSTEEKFREGLPKLVEAAAAAATLGCVNCCTYILPSTDWKAAHFMALATKRLRICAQILGAYNIRLGLEFVGPHHLRSQWKYPFIWTLGETLDWIEAIGEPNVGLLFDSYHWYTNKLTVKDIEELNASQIVYVHINDAPDVSVEEVLDNDRLYPGEGVIDLTGFLKGLQKIGYRGPVAQEVLTPAAPTDSTEILLQRSKEAFDKVFSSL